MWEAWQCIACQQLPIWAGLQLERGLVHCDQWAFAWRSSWDNLCIRARKQVSLCLLYANCTLLCRTLNGTGPRIESLTFAPVRTGTQAFVDCYDKLVPDSLRVINEEDYLGGEFLRNVYEHVRYELHCANNDSRTVKLPDSPSAEVRVCRHIMSRVSQTTSPVRPTWSWKDPLFVLVGYSWTDS